MTNSCVLRNRLPDPKTTTAARMRPPPPRTNAPTIVGLIRLPMLPLCFFRFVIFSAAGQEILHPLIFAILEQVLGVALRDHGSALRVEKNAVVADCKNAGEFMRDDDPRRAGVGAQLEDQVVEQARADRIEAGRRLVEEKYFRIECDRARKSRPLLHPTADLTRIVTLKALEPDQRQLQRGDVANLRLRQIGKLAERQSDVFRQRHRAPQRAALTQHAEMPQHLLAPLRLALGEIEIAVPDFALGRLDQSEHVAE